MPRRGPVKAKIPSGASLLKAVVAREKTPERLKSGAAGRSSKSSTGGANARRSKSRHPPMTGTPRVRPVRRSSRSLSTGSKKVLTPAPGRRGTAQLRFATPRGRIVKAGSSKEEGQTTTAPVDNLSKTDKSSGTGLHLTSLADLAGTEETDDIQRLKEQLYDCHALIEVLSKKVLSDHAEGTDAENAGVGSSVIHSSIMPKYEKLSKDFEALQLEMSSLKGANNLLRLELKTLSDERDVLERSEEMLERALRTMTDKLKDIEEGQKTNDKKHRREVLERAAEEEELRNNLLKELTQETKIKLGETEAEFARKYKAVEEEKARAEREAINAGVALRAAQGELVDFKTAATQIQTRLEEEKSAALEEAIKATALARSADAKKEKAELEIAQTLSNIEKIKEQSAKDAQQGVGNLRIEYEQMVQKYDALSKQYKSNEDGHQAALASAKSSIEMLEAALEEARSSSAEAILHASEEGKSQIVDRVEAAAEAQVTAISSKLEALGIAARDAMLEHEREMSAAKAEIVNLQESVTASSEAAEAEAKSYLEALSELSKVKSDLSEAHEAAHVLESALKVEKQDGEESLKQALDALREIETSTQEKLSLAKESNAKLSNRIEILEDEKKRAELLAETLERERLEDRLMIEKRVSTEKAKLIESVTKEVTESIATEMEERVSNAARNRDNALLSASQAQESLKSAHSEIDRLQAEQKRLLEVSETSTAAIDEHKKIVLDLESQRSALQNEIREAQIHAKHEREEAVAKAVKHALAVAASDSKSATEKMMQAAEEAKILAVKEAVFRESELMAEHESKAVSTAVEESVLSERKINAEEICTLEKDFAEKIANLTAKIKVTEENFKAEREMGLSKVEQLEERDTVISKLAKNLRRAESKAADLAKAEQSLIVQLEDTVSEKKALSEELSSLKELLHPNALEMQAQSAVQLVETQRAMASLEEEKLRLEELLLDANRRLKTKSYRDSTTQSGITDRETSSRHPPSLTEDVMHQEPNESNHEKPKSTKSMTNIDHQLDSEDGIQSHIGKNQTDSKSLIGKSNGTASGSNKPDGDIVHGKMDANETDVQETMQRAALNQSEGSSQDSWDSKVFTVLVGEDSLETEHKKIVGHEDKVEEEHEPADVPPSLPVSTSDEAGSPTIADITATAGISIDNSFDSPDTNENDAVGGEVTHEAKNNSVSFTAQMLALADESVNASGVNRNNLSAMTDSSSQVETPVRASIALKSVTSSPSSPVSYSAEEKQATHSKLRYETTAQYMPSPLMPKKASLERLKMMAQSYASDTLSPAPQTPAARTFEEYYRRALESATSSTSPISYNSSPRSSTGSLSSPAQFVKSLQNEMVLRFKSPPPPPPTPQTQHKLGHHEGTRSQEIMTLSHLAPPPPPPTPMAALPPTPYDSYVAQRREVATASTKLFVDIETDAAGTTETLALSSFSDLEDAMSVCEVKYGMNKEARSNLYSYLSSLLTDHISKEG